jgi:hypothetical protein
MIIMYLQQKLLDDKEKAEPQKNDKNFPEKVKHKKKKKKRKKNQEETKVVHNFLLGHSSVNNVAVLVICKLILYHSIF